MNTVLMLSLISMIWGKAFSFSPEFQTLDADKFAHHFLTRKVYSVMVDVRGEEEFAKGHLNNAVHLPLEGDWLESLDDLLSEKDAPKSVLLFVYGGSEKEQLDLKLMLEKAAEEKVRLKHKFPIVYLRGTAFQI